MTHTGTHDTSGRLIKPHANPMVILTKQPWRVYISGPPSGTTWEAGPGPLLCTARHKTSFLLRALLLYMQKTFKTYAEATKTGWWSEQSPCIIRWGIRTAVCRFVVVPDDANKTCVCVCVDVDQMITCRAMCNVWSYLISPRLFFSMTSGTECVCARTQLSLTTLVLLGIF